MSFAPYVFSPPLRSVRERHRATLTESGSPITCTCIGASLMSSPLDMFRIGTGERFVLYVGAHRGTDWMSACILYRFLYDSARDVTEGRSYGGVDARFFFSTYSVFVLPMLNVDGCELCMTGEAQAPLDVRQRRMSGGADFSSWQANARGVDLCRNYDYAYATYKAREAADRIEAGPSGYSGEYPESEPEVHALASFIRTLMPKGIVSLQMGEGCILVSPTEQAAPGRIATRLSQVIGVPSRPLEGMAAYGSFCAFTGERLGIPSFRLSFDAGEGGALTDTALYPRLRASLVRFARFL